jgi:hypothetical protein
MLRFNIPVEFEAPSERLCLSAFTRTDGLRLKEPPETGEPVRSAPVAFSLGSKRDEDQSVEQLNPAGSANKMTLL